MNASLLRRSATMCLGLTAALSSPALAQHFPWKHGDKPPTLAGFRLYEKAATARDRLGPGISTDTLGDRADPAVAFTSSKRGVSVVTSRLDGVAIIYVTRREAAMLDSIRVGDTRDRVLARWGPPSTGNGNVALWIVDNWVVSVQLGPDNRVARLGVGRQG
jgi:hypothetical protein